MRLQISKRIFNEAYYPYLLSYDNRYEVYYGGAGSGKSHFIAQKILYKALTSKRKILVARKVGRTIKQSVFQLLLDTLVDWRIADKCSINRTDFTIELPNGSVFICTGVDDVEKLKSITGLTDAWLEEATEFIQEDFNQIDLRIRHRTAPNQQIYLSFNPVSKVNWCYRAYFESGAPANTLIVHTTYKDNRYLPQDYIDSLLRMKDTNPAYYRIYALGEFGSLDKLVFSNWRVAPVDYAGLDGELMIGLDFGFVNDPTAIVASIMDEEHKRIYVFREYFKKGLLNNQIASTLKELGFAKSTIIADSAEQKSIEEIKREGILRIRPSVKGKDSIMQGITKLQQYEIIIDPACPHLIEEFRNYSWEKDKQSGEYINKPTDMYNHGIDALRYSLQSVGKKVKFMSKGALGL